MELYYLHYKVCPLQVIPRIIRIECETVQTHAYMWVQNNQTTHTQRYRKKGFSKSAIIVHILYILYKRQAFFFSTNSSYPQNLKSYQIWRHSISLGRSQTQKHDTLTKTHNQCEAQNQIISMKYTGNVAFCAKVAKAF